MSDDRILDSIKNHLENFSLVITKSVDNLAAQTAKNAEQSAKNANDISRLEVVVENLGNITKEQNTKLTAAVEKAMAAQTEIAVGQNKLSMEYQRLEFDRKEAREDVQAIYGKMHEMQKTCDKNREDYQNEMAQVKTRINRIYIIAGTLSAVGAVGATIVKLVLDLIKASST